MMCMYMNVYEVYVCVYVYVYECVCMNVYEVHVCVYVYVYECV